MLNNDDGVSDEEILDAVQDAQQPSAPPVEPVDVDALAAALTAIDDVNERSERVRAEIYELGLNGTDFGVVGRLRDRLTAGGPKDRLITKGEFDRAHQRGAKERDQQERDRAEADRRDRAEARGLRRVEMAWAKGLGLPDGFTVPDEWDVSHDGVLFFPAEGAVLRAAYAPLVPVRVLLDPDGAQSVELAWRTGGRWVRRTIPKSTMKSGRRLVQALGDAGIPIIEADARTAERWLATVEAANEAVMPPQDLARWLGWQPDGSFLSAADGSRPLEPKYPEQAPYVAAHHPAGTLADWQAAIKSVESFPAVRAVLAAGFAAALLRVLNVDSFVLDVAGASSRGKTTAARVGLSPWADPGEKADGMYTWKTKMLAAEYRLNIVRGIPVPFDESQLVEDPGVVDTLLYQVPKNHGQHRGGGWPSGLPWETVVISTGERPALSFTSSQGAAARVLSLRTAPMGENTPDNGQAARDIVTGVTSNYGTAGPEFAARLVAELASEDAADRIRARHEELSGQLAGTTGMSGRRAPMVAALVLADRCACGWGIVPFGPLPLEIWRDLLVADDPADNRPEMALDAVREFVAANPNGLWWPKTNRIQPPAGWIGRVTVEAGRECVALFAGRLREALERRGIELDAVAPGWVEVEALVKDEKFRPAHVPNRYVNGTRSRVYIFAPGIVDVPFYEDTPTPDGDGT
ncbi:DUF927 domain-containing protein [Parafrankia elaeagni]|uniref:DUF927 domain-containing protein n=1 Tax=Parafrankia elaeagni TaxID=222534 RepID=UPI00036BC3AF|nr:DUF927 domain-containing protein [Parafrankia elaeagni]